MEQKQVIKSVQHLSLAQIAVLNAIKSGCVNAKTIAEKTGQFEVGVVEVLKNLEAMKFVKYENGVASFPENKSDKRIRLGGNLNLPISHFRDVNGNYFVSRGTWHQIDPDVTLEMIDWYDDTENEESTLQKIMRGVKEQKIKEKKAALPQIKEEDGEPTVEDVKLLGAWRIVNDNIKIYPCEVSAKRAIIEMSPRFFTENGTEYSYGVCSPKQVITLETLHELLNGNISNLPKYSIDEAIAYIPNTFPVKSFEDGDSIGFEYLSIKKSSEGMKIIDTLMTLKPKEKWSTLDTITLDKMKGADYIKKVAILSMEKCNSLQELTSKE